MTYLMDDALLLSVVGFALSFMFCIFLLTAALTAVLTRYLGITRDNPFRAYIFVMTFFMATGIAILVILIMK